MSDWYDRSNLPTQRSRLVSEDLRSEFLLIETNITNKLPALTGNGDKIVKVNAAGTALEAGDAEEADLLTAAAAAAAYSPLGHTHPYLANVVEDVTPQLGGDLEANGKDILMADEEIRRPRFTDYAVTHGAVSSSGNELTLDYAVAQSFSITLTENITTLTLSNPPATGIYGVLEIEITQDSSARTITWPASVLWPGGTAPDLTTVSSVHLIQLRTRNGGTTWLGTYASEFA